MTNKIISRNTIKMKSIDSIDNYIESIKKEKIDSLHKHSYLGLDRPEKMKDYLRQIEDFTTSLNQLVKDWDDEYYVLEALGKKFDFEKRIYTFDSIRLRLIKREFDTMPNMEDTTQYARMLKMSNEDIDNWYYNKYGIYNGKPLYINDDLKEVIDTNNYSIKEVHHEEVRGSISEDVKCNGNTYERITEHKWFFDGIVINDSHDRNIWTIGTTGVYDSDWFGCKAHTYKAKEIVGPVKFIRRV